MQEIFSAIDHWAMENEPLALATVIKTWGSSPRGVGAKMVVNADGEMVGSVSGGCVEGAVVETGVKVIQTGEPQLLHFGVSDETALDVGLACGGEIEVYVRRLNVGIIKALQKGWEAGIPAALTVVIRGPKDLLGQEMLLLESGQITGNIAHSLCGVVEANAWMALESNSTSRETVTLMDGTGIEIFTDVIPSLPTLVIVGGVHTAIPLVTFANTLGYRTIVIDPRRKFGSAARFKHADLVINAWPEKAFSKINLTANMAVAVLTHDPKIDDPALKAVINSPVFYVGALGSRKTQDLRRERLLSSGFTPMQVARIKGPIGLELGGRSPEEIALAIMAEIIKEKNKS
jgi:xanthine dehydrogenase accessory factor